MALSLERMLSLPDPPLTFKVREGLDCVPLTPSPGASYSKEARGEGGMGKR